MHRGRPVNQPVSRLPAARLRRGMRLTLAPQGAPYAMNGPVPVTVTLTNGNPEPVRIHALAPGFMHFSLGSGNACRGGPPAPTAARPGNFVVLAPGDQLQRVVNLDRFCGPVPTGHWRVILDYHVPGLGRPDALAGTFRGQTSLTVRGYTPPPAPTPTAGLSLSIQRPTRTRVGQPLDVEVTLANTGAQPVYALPLRPGASRSR